MLAAHALAARLPAFSDRLATEFDAARRRGVSALAWGMARLQCTVFPITKANRFHRFLVLGIVFRMIHSFDHALTCAFVQKPDTMRLWGEWWRSGDVGEAVLVACSR
jgi:hypothetical protein